MPSDGYFAFRVLVGGQALPEYTMEGETYVESNLWTPCSYQQEVTELVNGEKEVQNFPVTPYQLVLKLGHHSEASAFFIYVDGVLVTKVLLEKGETRVVRGFQDRSGTKEFLFALPRFARNETDKLDTSRKSKVGKIEIVRKTGSFVKEEYRPMSDIKFHQANKKDAHTVTGGQYTMSTTKKGRYLNRSRPYEVKLKKMWRIENEVGHLSVNYRMGHTLEEMGIELKSMDWSTRNNQRASSTTSIESDNSVVEDGEHHHYLLTTNVDQIKQQPLENE